MRKLIPVLLTVCFLLCGCQNWLDGDYINVIPGRSSQCNPTEPPFPFAVIRNCTPS